MDSFLPNYRDPIFSILIILLTALAISMVAYWWNLYRQDRLKRELFNFLDRFDTSECMLDSQNLPYEEGMTKPLLMLARAFEQSGEYDKAISICLYLIKHTKDDEILLYLAKVYMHAGLLKRAEEIFLEVLSRYPRRKELLYQLELLYENLHDYNSANDVLNSLEALGEDILHLRYYIEYLQTISNKEITPKEKASKLYSLLQNEPTLYRAIIKQLFSLDTSMAWSLIDKQKIMDIIDILWYLPYSQLQLDIISNETTLNAIYFGRGDIDRFDNQRCGIFAIDTLCASRKGGYREGDLLFTYLCIDCKQTFPVSFDRCPSCMALNSIKVEETLAKRQTKRGEALL